MSHSPPLSGMPCIPVPRLHAALGTPGLSPQPADTIPWTTLPAPHAGTTRSRDDAPPLHSPLCALPLNPAETRACLADLRAMPPEEIARALQLAAAEPLRDPLHQSERAALNGFLHSHARQADTGPAETTDRLRQAQSQLLMVWVQEERLLEILELTRRCAAAESRLSRLLAEPESDEPETHGAAENTAALAPKNAAEAETVRGLLPPWRFVMTRLRPFLPPDALLAVNDPDMAEVVRAVGTPEHTARPEVGPGQLFRVDMASLLPQGSGVFLFFIPAPQRIPA